MKVWKNKKGVSPVIATILMVAITVVLAAVLYVMVMGMITGPTTTPKSVGLEARRSTDGAIWTVTVVSVSGDVYLNKLIPQIWNKDGTRNFAVTIKLFNATGTTPLASQTGANWPVPTLTGRLTGGFYFQFPTDPNMDEFRLADDTGVIGTARLT